MSNLQLINNLRVLRKLNNLKQKDLARILNISRQAYSNYETGTRLPDSNLLVKLSEIYSLTVDQLLTDTVTTDGLIKENSAPYVIGMDVVSGDTLYLTEAEVQVIQKYRTLAADNKRIVDQFLNHQ